MHPGVLGNFWILTHILPGGGIFSKVPLIYPMVLLLLVTFHFRENLNHKMTRTKAVITTAGQSLVEAEELVLDCTKSVVTDRGQWRLEKSDVIKHPQIYSFQNYPSKDS